MDATGSCVERNARDVNRSRQSRPKRRYVKEQHALRVGCLFGINNEKDVDKKKNREGHIRDRPETNKTTKLYT